MEALLGRDIGGRSTLVARGLMALVVLVVFGAFVTAYARGAFGDTVHVRAVVYDAGGSLVSGADVKSRGVIIGRTTGVTIVGDSVVGDAVDSDSVSIGLDIEADAAARLPSNVTARILPATAFGTSYVDLVIPESPSPQAMKPGQIVHEDVTNQTLELQTTLDSAYRVISAVDPAELAMTLGAMSAALEGRGEQVGDSVVQLERLLKKINPKVPLIQRDIALLTENLRTAQQHAPEVLTALDDALVTARTVTAQSTQITALLTGGGALVEDVDKFLTSEEKQIVAAIDKTAATVDAMYDNRNELAPGIRAFMEFGSNGIPALSNGPWLTTSARIVTSAGEAYTAADCPRFGTVFGDNCVGPTLASPTPISPAAAPKPRADDPNLIAEIQGLLSNLEGLTDGGIGELLSRPYVRGGAQ